MKVQQKTKMVSCGLLRGIVGEDGEKVAAGEVIECKKGLGKILEAAGRAVILTGADGKESEEAVARFTRELQVKAAEKQSRGPAKKG